MANEFYDHTTFPANGAPGSSSAMRSELDAIEAAFDKLPTMTGNGSEIVVVNSGGTALETTGTTGTGNIVRSASPTFTGTITAAAMNMSGNLAVSGSTTVGTTLGVTGAATLSSTLAVTSNTTVGGTLGVVGITTLTGALTANGAVSVNNTLAVTGATSMAGITASGAAVLQSTLAVTGNTTLTGTLTANGAVTVDDTFNATGAGDFDSTLIVGGATTLSSTLAVTGVTTLTGALNANGAVTVDDTLNVTGAVDFDSNLNVDGTLNVEGATTVDDTLTVTGAIASTAAGSTVTAQLALNGATNNWIGWNTNGLAAPAVSTRSAGTKLVLYPSLTAANLDMAIGAESSGVMWYSVSTTSGSFKWFAGNAGTPFATLTGTGVLSTAAFRCDGSLASGGIGYTTGAGGTVTQITSKSTSVSLDAFSGEITMINSALAANTTVSFSMINNRISATDLLILNHVSGGTLGSYTLNANCGAGTVQINVRNNTAGSLSEAIVIGFAVIKAVTS